MKKYTIQEKIGSGKFGVVYRGTNKKTNEFVALKMENFNAPLKLLKHEATILKYLYDHESRTTPIAYWFGIHLQHTCLVMSYYDCSLHQYIHSKELSSEKMSSIMVKAIYILETIHKLFVIHRDIKPHNFMIKEGDLFLIDFGLSTFYVGDNGEHRQPESSESLIGTPKYISFNIHNGESPSRRDDLISLGYIYIYLYCRELPWDTLKSDEINDRFFDEISIHHPKNKQRLELKSWVNLEPICSKINQNLYSFLNYCYGLKYKDVPNYDALKTAFCIL